MAITWTEDADSQQHLGPSGIMQQSTAAFSVSDYATGGYSIPAANFGMSRIRGLFVAAQTGTTEGYLWVYDNSTNPGKLKAYVTSTGEQAAADTDFSAGTLTLLAYGY